ncbi:MAG: 2-oxo-4-hydroxy-4-carboxy-5-ureidoimidazoline decarboxylase [Woeseiaceae bacterium]
MADANRTEFLRRYGGIYEHSPWVAEQACEEAKGIKDPDRLAEIFAKHVDAAGHDKQLALIQAHPDLAGRAAVGARTTGDHPNDEFTEASQEEQQSAGIDQCTPEEYTRFQDYNHRYKKKFGFPFIMAVRNSNRHEILKAFEQRLENDPATEFTTAMQEIHKIASLRFHAVGARTAGDLPIETAANRRS